MNEHSMEGSGIYYRTNDFVDSRPTLVFIHGLTGSSSAWLPHEERFKDSHNIVSYDLRGHGKSKKFAKSENYALECFVEDLHLLLEELRIRRATLVSHSFGTMIALAYLREHPEKISAGIFLSTILSLRKGPMSPLLFAAVATVSLFDRMPASTRMGNHIDYRRFPDSSDWDLPRIFTEMRETSLSVWSRTMRQVFDVDFSGTLDSIMVPTLIIHGRRDSYAPLANATMFHDRVKHSTLDVLDDADHIIVIAHHEEVLARISDFLKTNAL